MTLSGRTKNLFFDNAKPKRACIKIIEGAADNLYFQESINVFSEKMAFNPLSVLK